MNKIANVIFAYSPNNDDELELTVGDRIEVIGFEEEGWLKGRLRGRVGVFPENFVQLLESTDTTPTSTLNQNNTNKLNSIFVSRVSSKNSISSNSLNSNNNNNNNSSSNNIKNSVSNNNLIMNNTHQQQHEGDAASNEYPYSSESMHSTSSLGTERRPKPLKGIGYGDIFAAAAKTKPLPADPPVARPTPFAKASDRPSATNSLASTLQKSIPKKPPPPAPVDNGSTNGSGPDQAPALPPKPINQFNPLLNQRTNTAHKTQLARVIYAYKPDNDDELELEVGDIINVLDMKIEDAGWWRGELRGRVGVFPDNFVELIKPLPPSNQETIGQSNISVSQSVTNNSIFQQAQQQQQPLPPPISTEARPVMKSVFAGTPKGFSKELESNLEKHSNPAAFLSLKRNKLQQMTSTTSAGAESHHSMLTLDTEAALASPISHPSMNNSDSSDKQNGHGVSSSESSPGKLNHITANRAKGPSRRPPSNILNKRNQINELSNNSNSRKQELNESKEELPSASLPVFNQVAQSQQSQLTDHGFLASLPAEQTTTNQKNTSPSITAAATATAVSSPFNTHTQSVHELASPMSSKTNSNNNSSPPKNNQHASNDVNISPSTPKFNQRTTNSTLGVVQPESKSRLSSESSPSTPPWMVELRKTNAEKKRDPLPASAASSLVESIISNSSQPVPSQTPTTTTITSSTVTSSASVAAAAIVSTPAQAPAAAMAAIPSTPVATSNVASTTTQTSTSMMNENVLQQTKHDHNNIISSNSKHQISRDVTNEIDELRNEVRKLRDEFKGMNELKEALDTVKIELKACQSATENQRRYIKELVNNLADERKKIAEMQVEIDRNLR